MTKGDEIPQPSRARKWRFPLAARVVTGVLLGILAGVLFGTRPIVPGVSTEQLGALGLLVIRLLKAFATPLILLAILDSFLRTRIRARSGLRLLAICAVNVSVAMLIGLTVLNLVQPGRAWQGRVEQLEAQVGGTAPAAPPGSKPSLDPVANIAAHVPESLVEPFLHNDVIAVVVVGLLLGAALRRIKDRGPTGDAIVAVEHGVGVAYEIVMTALLWVAEIIPFAVFGLVAMVVGKSGLAVFSVLWIFLATMLAGLLLHAFGYYLLAAWLVGRRSPRTYLGKGLEAIVTGFSCNSSLATMPVTLRCLARMGISERSARLSACVGTNFNNDGIMLYEAMAALFLCQALGIPLNLAQQVTIVLASVMVGVGIAGIPEAGLIILPLVLQAAGLPEAAVIAAIPLIVPVDWIIARVRTVVNVMADMLVAILLDRVDPPDLNDRDASASGECAPAPHAAPS
jgi:DAACS family dicarboxylate/amino acid:cation (Na+ or H+) symporter